MVLFLRYVSSTRTLYSVDLIKKYFTDFMRTAFNVDDFQGLGRRKIWRLINLFLSEFFATAVFVYLGCATVQGNLFNQSQNHLTVAIAFSFAVGTSVMVRLEILTRENYSPIQITRDTFRLVIRTHQRISY